MTKDETEKYATAIACGRGVIENVTEMHARWLAAELAGDDDASDEIRTEAEESCCGVSVRSGWETPGEALEAAEYLLVMAGGGPAARITGNLPYGSNAFDCQVQGQDWFTPWVDVATESPEERDALDWYVSLFYFAD